MRVAVIGCGAAGLAAGRRLADSEHTFVIYEQTGNIGGTWVFTDRVGTDDNGLPVHTSMYKGLRTNLPKEIMGYPDFPIPEQEKSYIPSEDILTFLNLYCDNFNLRQHIKLNHHVKRVAPKGNGWTISVIDLIQNQESEDHFDAVMVCNGHYHTPFIPVIKGVETFIGEELHSHDYREPSIFKNKRVLVIGAGPSGIDLALEATTTATNVILSHRQDITIQSKFPSHMQLKPEVQFIDGRNVTFLDRTTTEVDLLIFCTGYKYSFPFLSPECGVRVESNAVQPLYKHLIAIERPTLCLIGLPFYVCAFSLFDLQARFFLKTLSGETVLPSKEEMLRDTKKEKEFRDKLGMKKNQFHMMGPLQGDYYSDLAKMGDLERLPAVMTKLHNEASDRQLSDIRNFRQDNYRIVDEENFVKVN